MVFGKVGRLAILYSLVASASAKDWLSPEYTDFFKYPLPVPPTKTPRRTLTNPKTGNPIDFYEITIKPFQQQVYPKLGKTSLVGYDGISPGPTVRVDRYRETVVRFINQGNGPNSVHLHGSYSRAPWDGWAEDTTPVGWYKDYYYPNRQPARTLWYHDHAVNHTAENAYFGQAGFYILSDPAEKTLGLPSSAYDVALSLSSKQYNSDGSLYSPVNEKDSLFGDVIHVNGQPWPFMNVEPRKYRLRLLNAAISRSFIVYLERDSAVGKKLNFQVISSDGGLLSGPILSTDLAISMAERWDIVVDFAAYAGQNVTLRNQEDVGADKDYAATNKVMRFVVGNAVSDKSNNGVVPSTLRAVPWPKDKTGVDHHFRFERGNGGWQINGVTFADPNNRVLAKPKRGTVEIWELENSSGGWTHPVHVHLVDFKILKRTGGKRGVLPYEAAGLKDVVWLSKGEMVTVEAHYAPWDGLYMFHCHNLIHEDHEMMAAFNVTALDDLGYKETKFIDPMEARWRAKKYNAASDSTDSQIDLRVKDMASFEPYNKVEEVESVLSKYWATKTASTLVTRTTSTSSSTAKSTTTHS